MLPARCQITCNFFYLRELLHMPVVVRLFENACGTSRLYGRPDTSLTRLMWAPTNQRGFFRTATQEVPGHAQRCELRIQLLALALIAPTTITAITISNRRVLVLVMLAPLQRNTHPHRFPSGARSESICT